MFNDLATDLALSAIKVLDGLVKTLGTRYQNRDLELTGLCGLLNGYLAEVILWLEGKEGHADPSALARILGLLEDICKVRLPLQFQLGCRPHTTVASSH